MKIAYDPSLQLNLLSSTVHLLCGKPVINGQILQDFSAELVREDPEGFTLRYTTPTQGTFVIEAHQASPTAPACLRYQVEGLDPHTPLDSFGLQFDRIENARAYFRNGYMSWDGSQYIEAEALAGFETFEPRPETSFAMTQLLPRLGDANVLLGFDRHDRFQQTFTFDTRRCPVAMTILTLWDRKERSGLPACQSERLFVLEQDSVEAGLRAWAQIVAASAPNPPRTQTIPITGWCSWYDLYSYISEQVILERLQGVARVAQSQNLPMRVFQIDEGFTPEMGDWLQVRPQFPRGMKPILDDIRAAGFIPGLWIGPFMVGNRSRLYHDHPDWVVRDRQTGEPLVQWSFYGESRWAHRSEEYYILDTTRAEAFEYLRHVFHVWRSEWGCEYFKTDFMFYGCEYGPDRAVWHTPGMTRVEIWRQVADMIRTEIGDAIWLGCGCPLWASVGLVDGIRIGHDIGVSWTGALSAQSLLRDLASRNYTNHILWQIDPDCVLLRERFHYLTDAEINALALYAGMSGGVILTSDALDELPPERVRLWKLIVNSAAGDCRFPFLGKSTLYAERSPSEHESGQPQHVLRASDPVLVQVRGALENDQVAAVFLFNTGEYLVQRTYPLAALGLSGPAYGIDWESGLPLAGPLERIDEVLPPHSGKLIFLSRMPMSELPGKLPG
jgi:alpha-galactosidase